MAADQDDSRDLLAKQRFRTGLMRRIDTELNRAREGMAYCLDAQVNAVNLKGDIIRTTKR